MTYRSLLLGCGRSRVKKIQPLGRSDWGELTTLDNSPDVNADVVLDLSYHTPLPFDADSFDEVHAYEVLEHIGDQGDFATLFLQFTDYWRILKPGGFFVATVPRGDLWTWGDPGHRRMINRGTLVFLDQAAYAEQCDDPKTRTNMCDYRWVYRADFERVWRDEGLSNPDEFAFILRAVKPSRIK